MLTGKCLSQFPSKHVRPDQAEANCEARNESVTVPQMRQAPTRRAPFDKYSFPVTPESRKRQRNGTPWTQGEAERRWVRKSANIGEHDKGKVHKQSPGFPTAGYSLNPPNEGSARWASQRFQFWRMDGVQKSP